jgi:hypothetical protein
MSPTLSTYFKENVVVLASIQCIPTTTQLEVDSEVTSRKCTIESVGDQTYQVANLCESPLFATTIFCIGKVKLHFATTQLECRICSQENLALMTLEVNMILEYWCFLFPWSYFRFSP